MSSSTSMLDDVGFGDESIADGREQGHRDVVLAALVSIAAPRRFARTSIVALKVGGPNRNRDPLPRARH